MRLRMTIAIIIMLFTVPFWGEMAELIVTLTEAVQ